MEDGNFITRIDRPRPRSAPAASCDLGPYWRPRHWINRDEWTPYDLRDGRNYADNPFRLIEGGIRGVPWDEFGPEHFNRGFIDYVTTRRQLTSNDVPMRNLIVNYVPQIIRDAAFFRMFASFGRIESIKIMRDRETGYSFGYGFVNYYRLKDAMKARYIMNGKPVKHKYIKVSFARPPSEDIKDTNLFLTGLPEFVTELELEDMFCPYGVVVHRKVLRDYETGLPRGIGFVRYETKMEAAAAIENLNGKIPSGASGPIKVRLAQDQGKQKAVYLAGYEAAMEEQDIDPAEDLSTNTRPVGVPVLNPSGRAKTGRRKKSSKGAKVLYEHSNAHEGSHGSVRGGHNEGLIGNYRGGKIKGPPEGPFGSGPYRGRIPESGSSSDQNSNRKEGYSAENTNLYVCGLPDFVDEEELVSMFARFGLIVNRYILRDKRNLRPKGAGFVRFKTESEANAAIVAMNNTRPNGFPKLMTVKLAHDQSPKYYQNYQEEGCQGSWGNAGPNPYDDYSAPPWNAPIWDDDWSRDPRSAPDRPSSALPYAAAYSLRDVTTPRYDMRPHTTLPVVRPDADEPPEGPHGSRPARQRGLLGSLNGKPIRRKPRVRASMSSSDLTLFWRGYDHGSLVAPRRSDSVTTVAKWKHTS